ncbi:hypothetical protein M422DRAFT_36017 [Sphaerobolus stellatus SS14]|uniref:Piwi domain-containing protein n=1 Tax=Sphaerobolus stellatus (strain SS14) TaxID=990650 RepID=A0A0C9V3K6_SPHS4|nr:hypothetical protein M422DRAFT_36017 [Sphaerobolus stellatus SS14]
MSKVARHSGERRNRKPGTVGRPVQVVTNLFPIETLPRDKFYHYDGAFDGHYNRRRKLEIMDRLQIQEADIFSPRAVYDGEKNLFRSHALDLGGNNGATFTVYFGDNAAEARRRGSRGIKVQIKCVTKIDPNSLIKVLNGVAGQMGSEELSSMTLMNILIRIKPIMTNPSNSRSFFVESTKDVTVGRGFELWRGYFQSVRLSTDRLTVNVDLSTAVMYQGGKLLNVVMAHLGINNVLDLSPEKVDRRRLEHFLKGLLVYPDFPKLPPGRSPKYRPIKKLIGEGADRYIFEVPIANGQTQRLSISEHFHRAHHYRVQFGRIICIGFSKDIVYPLEVLNVKPGQFYKKVLPGPIATKALSFATQKPQQRLQYIERAGQHLGYSQSDYLRHSGVVIGTQLMKIPARILESPGIFFTESSRDAVGFAPNKGVWNVMDKEFLYGQKVDAWGVIAFTLLERRDIDLLRTFLGEFIRDCVKLGMHFPNGFPPLKEANPQGDFAAISAQLEDAKRLVKGQYGREPTFLLVILPDSAATVLSAVKHWGDTRVGIATQCTRISKVKQSATAPNNQYRNNIALKLNMKLGGSNWYPRNEDMHRLAASPVMVIGADVSHGSPDSKTPSVAGLVASWDKYFSRYVAFTGLQESRMEQIADLETMMTNAIHYFKSRNNGYFPARILFYRDGLSEGQFDVIAREEVRIIKKVLKAVMKEKPLPKLTFIVVGKRHHVRFFPQSPNDADNSGNCLSGLIVDRDIVHPIEYDFYLQSQAGLLGTSRSCHYTVILEENGIPVDALQVISYSLCHAYGRSTRAVSIPAPVYYADLVCRRGKFHSLYLRDGEDSDSIALSDQDMSLEEHKRHFRPIHRNLSDKMYWI